MSIYAADGSINVTEVDGLSYTGLYAADGSFNVVVSAGDVLTGLYHPCGAYNVVEAPVNTVVGLHSPSGALYVSTNGNPTGAMRVSGLTAALRVLRLNGEDLQLNNKNLILGI